MGLLDQIKQQFAGFGNFERKGIFEQVLVSLKRSGVNNQSIAKALELYAAHELVYACVNKIADVMNDADLIVQKLNSNGEWETIPDHRLVALMNKPNSYDVGEEFNRIRVQSEYVAGVAYFEKIYSKAKILVGLEPLLPTSVTAKLNQSRTEIEYYEVKNGNIKYNLLTDKMLVRRRADLTNLFSGLAPGVVAIKTVNADLGMSDYIEAFFDGGGMPTGILKVLNRNLTDTEIEAAQAKWNKRYGRGGSNQKGLAVLDQNADFQKVGSNLDELDAGPLSDRHESRICSPFGVPPILVGALVGLKYTTANATMKSALADFVINKISPELKAYRKWLTWNLLPEFENIALIEAGKIRVNFDMSQVGYLQEDLDKLHDRVRKDFAVGLITQNEARAETKRLPAKDGDKYLYELKQPVQLQTPTPEPPKSLPIIPEPKQLLPSETEEKKTVEFNGLTLGREPKGVELIIDLKKMVADGETAKESVTKILLKFRNLLIDEAVKEVENFDDSTIYQLTLDVNAKISTQLYKTFETAYQSGRKQVIDDIKRQLAAKSITDSTIEFKDLDEKTIAKIRQITDLTISKLLNEIQKRAIDLFILLTKLDAEDLLKLLREKLLGESIKWIDQNAGNSANILIQSGRADEIESQSDVIQFVEYSAILDKNTCLPCGDADGETAESSTDLTPVPNSDCLGGDNCRCFHVAIIV